MRVQTDLCEVSEALFLKIPYLKSSIRHSVSLYVNRVSEARDLRGQIPRGIWPYQDAKTKPQRLDLEAQNRAFEARVAKNVYSL